MLDSLRELAERLPGQEPPPELAGEVEAMRDSLTERVALYSGQPPLGAEALYDAMRYGMERYLWAVQEVAEYLRDLDPQHLDRAVELAQEGEDSFSAAEYEITQDQGWLGEFSQG